MKKQDLFLVVRCSHLDGFDPIDEVDSILAKKGWVWFGKYGEPLNKGLPAEIEEGERRIFVVLVERQKAALGGYKFALYRLAELSKSEPAGQSEYPAYYRSFIGRIGHWVKLTPYDGPKVELKDLLVRSSSQKLPNSLYHSMRGHFICRLGP
jgi:hypothetical protein